MKKICSLILQGVSAVVVEIESQLRPGLQKFAVVGLGDRSVSEAKERVLAAILESGLNVPYGNLVVSLLPGHVPKSGTHLDLAIAVSSILSSYTNINTTIDLSKTIFLGELSLSGGLERINGVALFAAQAKSLGFKTIVCPEENQEEARVVSKIEVIGVQDLNMTMDFIFGRYKPVEKVSKFRRRQDKRVTHARQRVRLANLKYILERPAVARIISIAIAGRHHILLDGPPGSGKTTLLNEAQFLMPRLGENEMIQSFQLQSLHNQIRIEDCAYPSFRSPHHSITSAALLGGGHPPQPGEITLAHHGVLFLDEIAEFQRQHLESLRQPMIAKEISIARANYKVNYPSNFQLFATRNPCPCGWAGSQSGKCNCSALQISNYQKKLSGAMLDRIDIKLSVNSLNRQRKSVKTKQTQSTSSKLSPEKLNEQIQNALNLQEKRYSALSKESSRFNSDYAGGIALFELKPESVKLAESINVEGKYTLRSFQKILRIARTIADLGNEQQISPDHIWEATTLNYQAA